MVDNEEILPKYWVYLDSIKVSNWELLHVFKCPMNYIFWSNYKML